MMFFIRLRWWSDDRWLPWRRWAPVEASVSRAYQSARWAVERRSCRLARGTFAPFIFVLNLFTFQYLWSDVWKFLYTVLKPVPLLPKLCYVFHLFQGLSDILLLWSDEFGRLHGLHHLVMLISFWEDLVFLTFLVVKCEVNQEIILMKRSTWVDVETGGRLGCNGEIFWSECAECYCSDCNPNYVCVCSDKVQWMLQKMDIFVNTK